MTFPRGRACLVHRPAEAVRLAKHALALDKQLTANENQLDELVKVSEASPLLEGDRRLPGHLSGLIRSMPDLAGSWLITGMPRSDSFPGRRRSSATGSSPLQGKEPDAVSID
ncbi:hypothetical protein GCM10023063_37380 [Arthrobacter methylotrophus]|uniref:hypothetical protein n=1 Tax=Arthrobacter methylotrophus TaxID=121291 RepID=UPI00338137DE